MTSAEIESTEKSKGKKNLPGIFKSRGYFSFFRLAILNMFTIFFTTNAHDSRIITHQK